MQLERKMRWNKWLITLFRRNENLKRAQFIREAICEARTRATFTWLSPHLEAKEVGGSGEEGRRVNVFRTGCCKETHVRAQKQLWWPVNPIVDWRRFYCFLQPRSPFFLLRRCMKPMSRQVVAASLFVGRVCYLLALSAVIYLQTQRLPLEPHTLAVKIKIRWQCHRTFGYFGSK